MTDGVYIKGTGVISPQKTFNNGILEEGFVHYTGNRFACIEPDYALYIDPRQIRRMSRIIRMSVASSIVAMKNAGIEKPEAVIVGTAFGCLDDTYAFLSKLVQFKEDMLSPTAFIHSTHNTIAAQIALHYKCYGYNSTYVHRSVSFESALADAFMLLEEGETGNVLVGGADEIIDAGFTIMDRLRLFKKTEELTATNLYESNSTGSVAGEGAAFFSLVNTYSPGCQAKVKAVESWSNIGADQVKNNIFKLLKNHGIDSPSVVLAGFNGDTKEDEITSMLTTEFSKNSVVTGFKHLCGDYGTSSSFALWMATKMLSRQLLAGVRGFENIKALPIKSVLIYNQLGNIHHSVILLESC